MITTRILRRTLVLLIASGLIGLSASSPLRGETIRFAAIGDYGTNTAAEAQVADLVASWSPGFVITAGDNSYGSTPIDLNIGQYYSEFIGAYTGAFGPGVDTNRFFPSLGNHDYSDGGGLAAYLNYFDLPGANILSPGASGNERYYDVVIGPVHIFAINSNSAEPDGVTAVSVQAAWLQAGLAGSVSPWNIVIFHHPPYSSSTVHGSEPYMQWPFEDWGADGVIAGHDHTYERIMRDDDSDGVYLPYFVNGLGGRPPYSFPTSGFVDGSVVRYNAANGAMLIEADDSTLTFWFYSVAQSSWVDVERLGGCCQHRGDANHDGRMDVGDLTFMVVYLFLNGATPPCFEEADVDASDSIDVSDVTAYILYMFSGGPAPLPCW